MPNTPATSPRACTSLTSKKKSSLRVLKLKGYHNLRKIIDTLQGSIWRATHLATKRSVVIKMTDRLLHSQSAALINGRQYTVSEDILMECKMLKHVTSERQKCPPSIVRYIDFFKSNKTYFLVMEDGGSSLLSFVQKAHRFIEEGQLEMSEWHKCCKLIFAQMLEAVQFLHSLNVCHFDVSLENFLIADVDVVCYEGKDGIEHISFVADTVQIKLCDFGLSAKFQKESSCRSRKFVGKPNYYSPEITKKTTFNAKKNDVWCIGVCLFMTILGGAPFGRSSKSDAYFQIIMRGEMMAMLKEWKRAHYVTPDLLHVLESVFKYEAERADIATVQKSAWLN